MLSRARMATRGRRADWESKGAKTFEEKVQDRLRDILAAEPENYLDRHQEAELLRIETSGIAALAPK